MHSKKAAHTDLVDDAYTMFLTDKEYTVAEIWIDDCTVKE